MREDLSLKMVFWVVATVAVLAWMSFCAGCASEPLTYEQRERLLYVAQGLQEMGNSVPRTVYVQPGYVQPLYQPPLRLAPQIPAGKLAPLTPVIPRP